MFSLNQVKASALLQSKWEVTVLSGSMWNLCSVRASGDIYVLFATRRKPLFSVENLEAAVLCE
jgi:hypothetical protein